jgi:hypothetical protein
MPSMPLAAAAWSDGATATAVTPASTAPSSIRTHALIFRITPPQGRFQVIVIYMPQIEKFRKDLAG